MSTKLLNFTFRSVNSENKNFEKIKANFDAKGIAYTSTTEGEGDAAVTTIKRDTVKVEAPVLAVAEWSTQFVDNMLADAVSDAIRKEFIDNLLPVDTSVIDTKWVESALAAQRASAISSELVEKLADLTEQVLRANQRDDDTISFITGLVKGKYNKRILDQFASAKAKFADSVKLLQAVIATQPEADRPDYDAAIEAFVNNLAKWLEEQENLQSKELDLSLI